MNYAHPPPPPPSSAPQCLNNNKGSTKNTTRSLQGNIDCSNSDQADDTHNKNTMMTTMMDEAIIVAQLESQANALKQETRKFMNRVRCENQKSISSSEDETEPKSSNDYEVGSNSKVIESTSTNNTTTTTMSSTCYSRRQNIKLEELMNSTATMQLFNGEQKESPGSEPLSELGSTTTTTTTTNANATNIDTPIRNTLVGPESRCKRRKKSTSFARSA